MIRRNPNSKSGAERLLLQSITIRWDKEVRGAPYSTRRNLHDRALPLPEVLFQYNRSYGIPYHDVVIVQDKQGFTTVKNIISIIPPKQHNPAIGCIGFEKTEPGYTFTYAYSAECGKPVRTDRFHNPLVEQMFSLTADEYGRSMYNGRHTLPDSGEWYYELHMLNALLTTSEQVDVLTATEPVKEYRQLEVLF